MTDENFPETVQLGRVRVPVISSLLSPIIINGLRKGWYERDERKAIEAAVQDGDRVLELGGGLGACSATAATVARLKSLTIVEANPNLLDAIRLTMSLNKIDGFELVWGAISTSPATSTRLQVGEHYWAARETSNTHGNTIEVPTLSPQEILNRAKPNVLICDIEGNEQDLIEVSDLSRLRSFIVEFHPDFYGMDTIEKLNAKLLSSGFIRLTEWTISDQPQVHHYTRSRS